MNDDRRAGLYIYHHLNTAGQPMEYRDWQADILRDQSPKVIVQKASQIGVTDLMIINLFHFAEKKMSTMYVLPSEKDRNVFVPRRIDRSIARVKYYRDGCNLERKDSDMKSQKTIFGTDCSFVGSNSATNFYEKPISVLIIDERDKCNSNNLIYAYDRLGAARKPFIYIMGNPTIEGYGIAEEFAKSDKKYWHIQCCACNEWQPLDWFINVVSQADDGCFSLREHQVVCRKCGGPLDRLSKGEWVAEFPSRKISGYQANKLFGDARLEVNGVTPIADMFADFEAAQNNPTFLQRFYNNVLGVPFESEGSKITATILSGCCDAGYLSFPLVVEEPTIAGCDVGSVLHLHISQMVDGRRRKVFAGTVRGFPELADMSRRFKVRTGVIDALPETHAVKNFIRENPQWLMCYYRSSDDKRMSLKPDWINRTVSVDRTESLDSSFADYCSKRVILPGNWRSIDNGDFVKQMKAPTRIYVEEKSVFVWDEGDQPDHHRHADNYESIAERLSHQSPRITFA